MTSLKWDRVGVIIFFWQFKNFISMPSSNPDRANNVPVGYVLYVIQIYNNKLVKLYLDIKSH